jgi:hypothetical protein
VLARVPMEYHNFETLTRKGSITLNAIYVDKVAWYCKAACRGGGNRNSMNVICLKHAKLFF